MSDIVLATLNAKYIHAAFGLRYLLANLGELKSRATLAEFDINQRPLDIAEALLAQKPRIIGLGVYIWNVAQTTEVVATLKRVRPDVIIILGGPEVSYETDSQEIVQLANYVITGEADLKFAELCHDLLRGKRPPLKIIPAELPQLSAVALPYAHYNDDDIAHRVIYVEASRGCPFTCEFCLSSLDIPVRQFPLDRFLASLEALLARGVKQFKFVDRTFNLNLNFSRAILQFFLARMRPGLFLHFEMVPDRLPPALRELIAQFPPGVLQFEVGIQTFDEATMERISRRQDLARLADNFHFLRAQTSVHIHADLIVGLPGESLESFAAGFDRLVALRPQEIQVGILKRLRGTPIVRHDAAWAVAWNPAPPYELLQNKLLDFATMQRLRRFARYWDLVANSGNFVETTPMLWTHTGGGTPASGPACSRVASLHAGPETDAPSGGGTPASNETSASFAFLRFSDWLFAQLGRQHSIALAHLVELLFKFLTTELGRDPQLVAEALWRDYQRGGHAERPAVLLPFLPTEATPGKRRDRSLSLKRQARHLA